MALKINSSQLNEQDNNQANNNVPTQEAPELTHIQQQEVHPQVQPTEQQQYQQSNYHGNEQQTMQQSMPNSTQYQQSMMQQPQQYPIMNEQGQQSMMQQPQQYPIMNEQGQQYLQNNTQPVSLMQKLDNTTPQPQLQQPITQQQINDNGLEPLNDQSKKWYTFSLIGCIVNIVISAVILVLIGYTNVFDFMLTDSTTFFITVELLSVIFGFTGPLQQGLIAGSLLSGMGLGCILNLRLDRSIRNKQKFVQICSVIAIMLTCGILPGVFCILGNKARGSI